MEPYGCSTHGLFLYMKVELMTLIEILEKHGACAEAKEWAKDRDSNLYNAWRACPRGDWLLWMASKLGIDRKLIVAAACDCAEEALKYVPDGEDRPANAIRVTRAWLDGNSSIYEVDEARRAAYAAANAAAAYVAAYAAASAAAYAAANAAAANAAYAAAYAAYAAAVDANAYDADADAMATLVRKAIPWTVWKEASAKGEDCQHLNRELVNMSDVICKDCGEVVTDEPQ